MVVEPRGRVGRLAGWGLGAKKVGMWDGLMVSLKESGLFRMILNKKFLTKNILIFKKLF